MGSSVHARSRCLVFLLLFSALVAGCDDGEETAQDVDELADQPATVPLVRMFHGSGSLGGTWTFQLDTASHLLACRKGTETPVHRSYVEEDQAPYRSFLKVEDQSGTSFGWEDENRLLVHNFPTGDGPAEVYVGVAEDARMQETPPSIAGAYAFLEMSEQGATGQPDRRWGTLVVDDAGAWFANLYPTVAISDEETSLPDESMSPFPPSGPGDTSGTWQVSSVAPWTWSFTGAEFVHTGYALIDDDSNVLVLAGDHGFWFAVGAPDTPMEPEAVRGNFQATVGTWSDSTRWHARWMMPGGEMTALGTYAIESIVAGTGDFTAQTRCGSLPHVFRALMQVDATGGPDDNQLFWFAAGARYSAQLVTAPDGSFLGWALGVEQ